MCSSFGRFGAESPSRAFSSQKSCKLQVGLKKARSNWVSTGSPSIASFRRRKTDDIIAQQWPAITATDANRIRFPFLVFFFVSRQKTADKIGLPINPTTQRPVLARRKLESNQKTHRKCWRRLGPGRAAAAATAATSWP